MEKISIFEDRFQELEKQFVITKSKLSKQIEELETRIANLEG